MNECDKIVEISSSDISITMDNTPSNAVCKVIPQMPEEMQYAYAYVRFQKYGNVYNADEALKNGTLFPELNMPYRGYDSRIVK